MLSISRRTLTIAVQNAPPKTKYIEHILVATHSGEAGIAEVFRALQYRLRDSTWTVVFKGLITTHLMIREGSPDVTLQFLARHRNMLAISNFTDGRTVIETSWMIRLTSLQLRPKVATSDITPIISQSEQDHTVILIPIGSAPKRHGWRNRRLTRACYARRSQSRTS